MASEVIQSKDLRCPQCWDVVEIQYDESFTSNHAARCPSCNLRMDALMFMHSLVKNIKQHSRIVNERNQWLFEFWKNANMADRFRFLMEREEELL